MALTPVGPQETKDEVSKTKAKLNEGTKHKKFTKEDLPIPFSERRCFYEKYVLEILVWVGEQEAVFNLPTDKLIDEMQRAWDKWFSEWPLVIGTREPVYVLVRGGIPNLMIVANPRSSPDRPHRRYMTSAPLSAVLQSTT